MIIRNHKPLAAVSYNTKTFEVLKRFLKQDDPFVNLERISPDDFFKNVDPRFQYVNLVTKDFEERKKISELLDYYNLDRFTYINQDWSTHNNTTFGPGSIIYPGVMAYYANVGKDVILHGRVSLAEDIKIGNGCFLSGLVTVAGSTTIGDYCFISTGVTIMDNLTIVNEVRLLPSMTIKKNIDRAGTYYNPHVFDIKEFKPLSVK